jgi:hypothetical protein
MSPVLLVLTSAGVAALVSGVITLLSQYLERRSRRNELILSKALDLAITRTDRVLKMVDAAPGRSATLYDDAFLAETYYRWFQHLLAHGKLPPDAAPMRPPPTRPMASGQ